MGGFQGHTCQARKLLNYTIISGSFNNNSNNNNSYSNNNNNSKSKSNDNVSYKSLEDDMLRVVHKSNQVS